MKTSGAAMLVAALLSLAQPLSAQEAELKFGTLAPDNTPWSAILKSFKINLQKATQGKVRVKLYLNGVRGDESVMLQQMKFGQLTGGGFSTGGISTVVPELQVLELPFLFDADAEADFVMDEVVREDMRKACEARGLYLYIWAVNGWLDFGETKKPIRGIDDLRGVKAQMQETEVQKAFWNSVGANPIPLAIPDVLNALQRGMVECFASTPIFASGAQWTTQTKCWTVSHHIYQPAAVVFDKKWWDSLSKDLQATILSFGPDLQRAARKDVRGLDPELFAQMTKDPKEGGQGIDVSQLSAEGRMQLRKATLGVGDQLVKKGVFSQELLDKVKGGIGRYRAEHGSPPHQEGSGK